MIRLGSAYRRNPELFTGTTINEHIKEYVDYLSGLQGLEVEERTDGTGFRLNANVEVINAFVPGPTNMTNLTVYIPGSTPTPLKTVPVVSLCGDLNGTAYDACIDHAATFYKCQEDEPCLNMSYIENTGVVTGTDNGYGVSRGWGFEFGCTMDVTLDEPTFNDSYNPCHIFYPETDENRTAQALFGFLQALPAVNDASESDGLDLFIRILNTYNYTEETYNTSEFTGSNAGFYGASLFLLYDSTGNETYLAQAHGMRSQVPNNLISDQTRGQEFYWEEYVLHEDAITNASLEYNYTGKNPSEFFRGKMFFDYKDAGPLAISKNGERVFQFDNNIRFQNSRFMLTEGLLAAKTTELHENPEDFIPEIAEAQLAWITGMNAVQNGTALGTNTMSVSFILGIGDHPKEFHSRYLVDTGYANLSSNQIVGARGTSLQFFNGTEYVFLDGRAEILGNELGALGNGYRNETKTQLFNKNQTFNNGKSIIPGWINGAFDIPEDIDVIFNYDDDLDTFQFTETTNEIVATAIELFAYLDGQHNAKSRHAGAFFNESDLPPPNGTLNLTTVPGNASVHLNVSTVGRTDPGSGELVVSWEPGVYDLMVVWPTLDVHIETIEIFPGNVTTVIAALPAIENGTFVFNVTPGNATVYLEGDEYLTDENGSLNISVPPGTYDIMIGLANKPYTVYNESLTIDEGQVYPVNVTLFPRNATLELNSEPSAADVFINDVLRGQTPFAIFNLIPESNYTINVTKFGYEHNSTTITPDIGEFISLNLTLRELPYVVLNNTINVPEVNGTHRITETDKVEITLDFDRNTTVNWTINGEHVNTTNDSNTKFSWTPGIFYVEQNRANEEDTSVITVITATLEEDVFTWILTVENEVNPFFGETFVPNSVTAVTLHVFTYNSSVNFTQLNVTMATNGGSTTTVYTLEPNPTPKGEIDWKFAIPATVGTNELIQITAYNENTGITKTYTVENRSFVRDFPSAGNDDQERPSVGGGGGGGGGGALPLEDPDPPEIVYAIFEENVVNVNDAQLIKLDAKIGFGDIIKGVEARILNPDGDIETIPLELVAGTKTYGTWEASFKDFKPGQYLLSSVDVFTGGGVKKNIRVKDRVFYASEGGVSADFNVVYALLDKSLVEQGTPVTLTLDASDSQGIQSAYALVELSNGESFTLPLEMVNGDSGYGTWEGVIETAEGDATYTVKEITLQRSEDEEKTVPIDQRSVYVERTEQTPLATGNVVGTDLRKVIKNPLLPTLTGFALMFLIMGLVLFSARLREKIGTR